VSDLYGQKLVKQINDLSLDVGVAWIGENLDSYVLNAGNPDGANHPLLFFNWVPNILTSGDQFSLVHFPVCNELLAKKEYAEESTARPENSCDFEVHQLTKVMWSLLKTHTPEAYHVVSNLQFSSDELNLLLQNYVRIWKDAVAGSSGADADLRSSELLEQAACDWIRSNELLWKRWLPTTISSKPTIYLGGMFPLTGPYWRVPEVVPGRFMS
jgi:hypothetical protein